MAQGLKALLYLVQWRTWRLGGLEAWVGFPVERVACALTLAIPRIPCAVDPDPPFSVPGASISLLQ
jgi:hypothetical protein